MVKKPIQESFLARKYFPGYKKYLWIDCDAWVNDWKSVELYFEAAAKRKLGITQTLGSRIQNYVKSKMVIRKDCCEIKSQNFKHAN